MKKECDDQEKHDEEEKHRVSEIKVCKKTWGVEKENKKPGVYESMVCENAQG